MVGWLPIETDLFHTMGSGIKLFVCKRSQGTASCGDQAGSRTDVRFAAEAHHNLRHPVIAYHFVPVITYYFCVFQVSAPVSPTPVYPSMGRVAQPFTRASNLLI